MLNRPGIKKETAGAPVQILYNVDNQMAVSIKVATTAGTVIGNRTIVKAGTPLAGNLLNRSTPFTAPVAGGEGVTASPAVGILLHDVDVTDGAGNGSLLIWGFVNLNRLETTTQALITDSVKESLKNAVWFLKD